ncbi:MAG: DUF4129 domain-containing protein [Pseudomonadales bacterium]|nr:DUF4129 domain-containing protein [Pseudomonadales bacterium]
MELEKASARLAPRSPWQAVDLGTQLYRRWAFPALRVWLAFTLLPYAALLGLTLWQESWWPLVVAWWLKPVWERPLLAWYSHALFGETLTVRQLFRRWRQYALPGLGAQLTWRRLSPARSFNTCVWQLENAKGDQLSQRLRVLNSVPSNRAGMLTIVVLHLEQFMSMGLIALLYMLVPWQFSLEFSDWFVDQGALQTGIATVCMYLAMCITEPLYVACGFALYLNKRTWLEGWDLQLGLTRLGRRRHQLSTTSAMAVLLAILLLPFSPSSEAATNRTDQEQQEVIELLASEDYMPFEEVTERRWKGEAGEDSNWMQEFWKAFFENLEDDVDTDTSNPPSIPDTLLWAVAWALFAALVIWLLIKVADQLGLGKGRAEDSTPVIPTHVAGMDIRRKSLPKNLRDAMEQCLASGDVRAALSLLLRTALADLLRRYPVRLAAGSTEQQCLRSLREQHGEPPPIRFLEALTRAWIRTAWAHRPVSEDTARALLADWETLPGEEAVDA